MIVESMCVQKPGPEVSKFLYHLSLNIHAVLFFPGSTGPEAASLWSYKLCLRFLTGGVCLWCRASHHASWSPIAFK